MGVSTFDLVLVILSGARVLFAPYFFVYGWVLISTFHLHQAYGTRIAGFGIAYVIISLNEAFSTTVGYFGIRKHNKALLFINLILDLFFAVLQLGCGTGLLTIVTPTTPYDIQQDCLRSVPVAHSAEVCQAFLRSDRTMGFRLAWYSYYTQAQKSAINYQILYHVQHKHGCCGFGPPQGCQVDTRPLPSQFPTYALFAPFKKQRQSCGVKPYWYMSSSTCNKVVDYNAAVWVYGGCQYDHPVGGCSKLEVQDRTEGCIPYFEQYMASKIRPHAEILVANNVLKFFAWFMALLIWLRRKDYDGIPRIFVTPEPPPYWIFRVLDKMSGREEDAQAGGGGATAMVTMGGKTRRAGMRATDAESKAVEPLSLAA